MVKVKKINTKVNWAKNFTKALPRDQFAFLRDAMMGWRKTSKLQAYINKNHMADLPIMPDIAVASLAKVHTNKIGKRRRKRKRRRRRKEEEKKKKS